MYAIEKGQKNWLNGYKNAVLKQITITQDSILKNEIAVKMLGFRTKRALLSPQMLSVWVLTSPMCVQLSILICLIL